VIELMMSLVLLGIGAALALPSYRDMVEKRQVTNGAEQLSAFVNTAQGLAQKRNRPVTVAYVRTSDTEWCLGMSEGEALCDCRDAPEACTVGGQSYVLNMDHANGRTLMTAASSASHAYYIDPVRGLFLPCQGGGSTCDEIDVSSQAGTLAAMGAPLDIDVTSPGGDFGLNLQVSNTGRVRLCNSTAAAQAIPGYTCTPGSGLEEGTGL
jgi:type IV fimbrial biogenesis protein FimT